MAGTRIKVLAEWQIWVVAMVSNRLGKERQQGKWESTGEAEVLEASDAPKRLTVWLSSGMRAFCGKNRASTPQKKFYHYFGTGKFPHNRIVFTPLPTTAERGE